MAVLRKWQKVSREILTNATVHDYIHLSMMSRSRGEEEEEEEEEESIPNDVPKGHVVVYVGEELKRFIIRVDYLAHPLFQVLLDRAQEEYEFSPDSKLCIPCEENLFLSILHCITSKQEHKIWWLCL
ncbi:auxin-induced protein 15A-like [Typha angustifolia]|uniref:auxin-induced protein 15A-like n=1 Tax=Typha angustifolia TaxID=59011 RepID=UPI003C2D8286